MQQEQYDFLSGGGEMGTLIRAHDWEQSPLGPPGLWPQALRVSMRLMLNTGHPMYIWWGADLLCFYNDAYRQSIGPERHPGSLGRPAREVWDEIWPIIGPQIEQVMSGGGATWQENALVPITRNGRREEVYWTYSYGPIDDAAAPNGVGGVLVVCTETTQQVLSMRRASEDLARFAALFDQAPNFMTMLRGPDHRFEFANPSYLQLVGRNDIVGKTVAEALPETAQQGFVALLDNVYRTGQPYIANSAEYVRQVVPGGPVSTRYLDFVYQPIRDATGAVTGIFVEGADATERALADAALIEANENLEAKIEARTRELIDAQEALRQSQKMEAVGQLTGGLAHDFNNLLTGISGSLELLQHRIQQGRYDALDRYINAGQGAVRRAAALTQRLLAFARRQTLNAKATNLNNVVTGMEELIRRTVGPAIEIEVVGAAGLWAAMVDVGQLESALLNLCLNARDAMPNGGRLIVETANKWLDAHAAKQHDLDPGQYVSLCVTDTGTGMPPEVINRIFDPFYTTKPLGEGTGLGLSMVYGFTRQSGGQVRVYSEMGKGTTMCLYLPRHHGKAEEEEQVAAAISTETQNTGKTILVVDDEPTVRMLIVEALEDSGFRIIEAGDGSAGLKLLQSAMPIDLLITDVGLPGGLNGRQLADAGRVLRPGIKTLFITGFAENAVMASGQLEPGMEVMTKPFSIENLSRRVRTLIAGLSESRSPT